MVFFVSKTG
uniref:Uncharacterized protein n=1 Tax=Rhizophora mucronata TaxID=61149 RepID=A0A2P2N5S4_RHIMU